MDQCSEDLQPSVPLLRVSVSGRHHACSCVEPTHCKCISLAVRPDCRKSRINKREKSNGTKLRCSRHGMRVGGKNNSTFVIIATLPIPPVHALYLFVVCLLTVCLKGNAIMIDEDDADHGDEGL
jgi:hypothetical protein